MATYNELVEHIEDARLASDAQEAALDAMAFVQALHQMFKDNGMTSSEEPNVDDLENLVDALHGELGAAVLFLCEPSFARVPDMLRVVSKQLEKFEDGSGVPPVVVKGFDRLAKRIENTRVNMQQLVATPMQEKA